LVKVVFETRTKMLIEEEKRKEEMFKLASIMEKKETQPLNDQEKSIEEGLTKTLEKSDSNADDFLQPPDIKKIKLIKKTILQNIED